MKPQFMALSFCLSLERGPSVNLSRKILDLRPSTDDNVTQDDNVTLR